MAQQKTVENILQIASISQYLAFKDKATKQVLKGGYKPPIIPLIISIERMCVQWQYDYDPNNSVLQGAANYVYGLCGGYAIQAENILANLDQSAPVVTGANNQSVEDGAVATFTIGVTSAVPYNIQWYSQDGIIPGATSLSYSFTAVLGQNGNTYYAVVSSSAGSTQSATGELTVAQTITGQAYWGDTYYYDQLLLGIDNVPYNLSFDIIDGQPFVVNFPSGAALNKYQIYRVPIGQPVKNRWDNTISDGGGIPGFVFNSPLTIGSYRYYISSEPLTIVYTNPMTLSTI